MFIVVSPVAMVTPTQLEVELGRTVVVECKGVGDPLPDMRWLLLPTMTVLPSPDHPNYVSLCVYFMDTVVSQFVSVLLGMR